MLSTTNHASIDRIFVQQLIDWYWAYGISRKGQHTEWLARLYHIAEDLGVVIDASERERSGLAVWGPSQAGKSTMLSQFIDNQEAATSAISWDDSRPYQFNKTDSDIPALGSVLN